MAPTAPVPAAPPDVAAGTQELAERTVGALRAADTVAAHLGIELLSVSPGRAAVSMRVAAEMTNGHGITHGGYVFLLADTAFAYACNSRGPATVAAGCDIDFLEPTRAGDELVATAAERSLRGRSGIYDVTVTCAGRAVAEFRGRSRTLPVPAGNAPDPATTRGARQ
ncbi:acyl-CoA thioesterase [Kineococcus xinjiangensis]|uniref:Acyl-CoA thioesterase n=1 Tax=Kineococcus xinjiangensis TaxID=512762 RepID=A0A2S6IK80_9ACTN|nr:hydroxyphenylacetyl-CoA thioesterase PaaI [Kineococcus xinjiangensis]PPK94585.1 acyl-CoA thioesterase [Kineococcus xinjiangensis]